MTSMATDTILLPGDESTFPTTTKIGPGLHSFPNTSPSFPSTPSIRAIKAGLLQSSSPQGTNKSSSQQYLSTSSRRYSPAQNDTVIAQIVARSGDAYRLDLGSSLPASMDQLAFYNVNRKSKPNLNTGDIVYARVSSHLSAMEPELRCDLLDGKGSGGFGVLTGGHLLRDLSLGLCRRLLSPQDITLQLLGDRIEYEVVVGMNGRIWIKAEQKKAVILIAQILRQIEFLNEAETRDLVIKRLKEL